ncbi:MAG: nucleotidyltransferase domain-containing protein [Thermodesulfobacterium sp.]|nr:nucleotidyltransferase domain-containing protein [Thermodesulfobacterium sp.]
MLFAYIFGSRATGKVHPESDLDIAIYLKEPLKDYTEKKLELIDLISALTGENEIDLVILNKASTLVVHSVESTEKLLFSKNEEKRVQFIVKNLKEYLDLEIQLKICWRAMKKKE